MTLSRLRQDPDLAILALLALSKLLLHILTNGQYGFHRDELATLDDARSLAWGYVAYPPVTPFLARISLELFGSSMAGLRFFAALAQSAALLLGGLIARELGGQRLAQILAALSVAIVPVSLSWSTVLQYNSLDYLWWVFTAYLMIRLLSSENPQWWIAIGALLGIGLMTKYTIAFLAAGIFGGLLLTPERRYLKSPWLWGGAAIALLIFLPNVIWQAQHDFVSLDFLRSIHTRDVLAGRTGGFLPLQFLISANPPCIPLWIAGIVFYFFLPAGQRYRLVGWMFVIPLGLFWAAEGRPYYIAAAYPMLLAAGAVVSEQWIATLRAGWKFRGQVLLWGALSLGGVLFAAFTLPIAPVNSAVWRFGVKRNVNWREEIGWPELVETVARIRDTLPVEERVRTGILAGNYGEAGAIDLYGPAFGLPPAISGVNSYWFHGYGDPPPETLIAIGFSREFLERNFESCQLAGQITNRYSVRNEETARHANIFVCRRLRQTWPEYWKRIKSYG